MSVTRWLATRCRQEHKALVVWRVSALIWSAGALGTAVADAAVAPGPAPAQVAGRPTAGATAADDATAWLEATAARLLQAGQAAQALPLAEAALQQREEAAGRAPQRSGASSAAARMLLAEVLQQLGRGDQAWALAQQAWQVVQVGDSTKLDLPLRLNLQHRWALLAEQQGDEAAALAAVTAVRQGWQAMAGAPLGPLVSALRDEAGLRAQAGQVGAAQALLGQAQALLEAPSAGRSATGPAQARLDARLQIDQAELLLRLGDAPGAARALAQVAVAMRDEQAVLPRSDRVDLLRGQAASARLQGDASAALAHLAQARALAEAEPALAVPVRAGLLSAQAELHRSLGDFPAARALGLAALALREAQLPARHPDIAHSHNNLGLTALESGDLPSAHRHLAQAQALWRHHPGRRTEAADTALNLAGLAAAEGRWADTANTLGQVLAQWRPLLDEHHPRVAVAQGQRAEALSRLGQPAQRAEADALFTQALATLAARQDLPVARGMAWARWADHQHRLGRPDLAILGGKQAVNAFQALRAQLAQGSRVAHPGAAPAAVSDPTLAQLRSSLLRQRQPVYLQLAARLMDAGRLPEAEAVTALLKRDELAELLRSAAPEAALQVLEPTGAEQAAIALSPDAVGHTARLAQRLEALRALNQAGALPEARLPELRAARAEMQAARDRYAAYLASLPRLLKPLTTHQRDEALTLNLQALGNLQGVLRDKLPAGTVLLHYLVLEDSLRILVTAPLFQQALQVNVPRQAITDAVGELRAALKEKEDPRPIAQRLHRWLIAPVQPVLDTLGAQVLMFAPTDTLRYLPFAALHDGQRWLAERYASSVYTAAASTALADAPRPQWRVQAFGTTGAHGGLSALPGVRPEIEAILGPKGLPGRMRLDADFTRDRLEDALDEREPVLHIASHFVFLPGNEGASYLLLGDGQRLSLQDIRGLSFQGADLVTLSACDTATGGGLGQHGAEVEGLGALVQQRQAKAVLATLWPVSDASTAVLMPRFYRLRGSPSAPTKAEALRQAQLAFIRGEAGTPAGHPSGGATGAAAGQTTDTRHPFYWAPFVLMGNWL